MAFLAIIIFLGLLTSIYQPVDAFYMQKTSHDKKTYETLEDYYTGDEKENFITYFPYDENLINEVEYNEEGLPFAPLLQKDDAIEATNIEELLIEGYIEEGPQVAPLLQNDGAIDATNIEELIIEGDIILNSKLEFLYMTKPSNPFVRSALLSQHRLWPDGVIPYTISEDYSEPQKNLILKAMKSFQDNTCITFIPKTEDHRGYVEIFRGSGCSSNVGRTGARQRISLGNGCLGHGTILHELMHTAGFWHEQSRYDRDDYIDIDWDNVQPNRRHNFNKHSNGQTTLLGQAYDYNSLMHYHSRAFAIDYSKPTIIPKDPQARIGNRRDFSELDIEGLNILYNCSTRLTNTTTAVTATTSATTTSATTTPPRTTATATTTPAPVTTTPTTTTTATTTTSEKSCTNTFSKCSEWADIGACENYPYFMMRYCKQSCDACDDTACDDENDQCAKWANQGHCSRSEKYMLKYCKRSCDQCN